MSNAYFSDVWRHHDWQDTVMRIDGQSSAAVERALHVPRPTLDDFMALVSPAATPYIEQMTAKAAHLTRQRFGHAIGLYVPLYLSNLCANQCTYCGFSAQNRIRRVTLDAQDIQRECDALKALGFDDVLLVTGEHPKQVGMDYFKRHLPDIRRRFSHLMMEVQPLSQSDYETLGALGLDGVLVYQETYHAPTYDAHHLKGFKKDFTYRLDTPDRLGHAGIDKIGLGVLLGLSAQWRADSYAMACHLQYLQRRYWRSRYAVSFPRLRPCEGGITPACDVSERQLLQLMCACRIVFPDVELSLSTRESPRFRDHVAPLLINTVSAYSSTQPGGYAEGTVQALAQFSPDDHRRPEVVAQALSAAGRHPVWKDWDAYLGRQPGGLPHA